MKIREQTPTRLVLAGVPGGWRWMIVLAVFGAVVTGIAVSLGVHAWRQGNWWNLAWLGLGVALGQVFLWTGFVTLLVGRERLVLDLVTGTGRYDVRSPIIETGSKPFEFDLANVHSVSLERFEEARPGGPESPGMTARVVRARLRTTKPRRAVKLDETENGRDERVRAIAEAVGEFLEIGVTETTR